MNLYEYQAKKLFSEFGLPVLNNWVCSDIFQIDKCVSYITNQSLWAVKCQIRSGGRGKSGGIAFVSTKEEISTFAKKWIGTALVTNQTTFTGEIVNSILIEPAVKIIRELYLSILIDKNTSKIVFLTSIKGGVNIEKLMFESPELLYKTTINPELSAIHPYKGRIIAHKLGLTGIQINQFVNIYTNVIRMFLEKDLMLVEVNPLVITDNNNLICLDAKVVIDNNALFRQFKLLNLCSEINKGNNSLDSDPLNLNYVSLNGNIGCMVNGAGLAMATMDLMSLLGGSPANFLDIGGDANENHIVSALKMLFENKKVQAIFVNIFGGIVCCDLVASSIIIAISEYTTNTPIVVRLEGNNSELGSNRLINSQYNIIVMNNLAHAIKKVIMLVNSYVDTN